MFPYLSHRCSSAALRGRRAGFSSILSTSAGFIPIFSKCCTVGCILVLTCCRSCAPLLISVIKGVKALDACPSSDTPSNLNALAPTQALEEPLYLACRPTHSSSLASHKVPHSSSAKAQRCALLQQVASRSRSLRLLFVLLWQPAAVCTHSRCSPRVLVRSDSGRTWRAAESLHLVRKLEQFGKRTQEGYAQREREILHPLAHSSCVVRLHS